MDRPELLTTYEYPRKRRFGERRDGGYVVADLDSPQGREDGGYDAYISAGVSDEESFSRDFIEHYQLKKDQCYAFDRTIHDYPYQYTREITYIKKNIHARDTEEGTTLRDLTTRYRNIFLKMDIEGGEFPWLLQADDQLPSFRQIVLEVHGITRGNDQWGAPNATKLECLEKLQGTHVLVHVHGNNFGTLCDGIPDVIELTYVRRDVLPNPSRQRTSFPIPGLDYPNNPNQPDFVLDQPPFVEH